MTGIDRHEQISAGAVSRARRVAGRAAIAIGLAFALSLCAPRAEAQITYIGSFEGHDYYANRTQLTFSNARLGATALGQQLGATAYLASVTSPQEQQFLACATGGGYFWLGLIRNGNPPTPRDRYRWVWDSGEPYVYDQTFWCPGEPSDQNGVEDAGLFGWGAGGCWNDIGPWVAGSQVTSSLIEVVPAP